MFIDQHDQMMCVCVRGIILRSHTIIVSVSFD